MVSSHQATRTLKKLLRSLRKRMSSTKQQESVEKMANPKLQTAEEMMENAANEALEARLAVLLATAPAAEPAEITLYMWESAGSVRVYTGCQKAGPQVAG